MSFRTIARVCLAALLFVVVLVGCAGDQTAQAQPRETTRWEYKIVQTQRETASQYEDILNGLGQDGWELIVAPGLGLMVLKRPMSAPTTP